MKEFGLRMNGTTQKITFATPSSLGNIKLQAFTHSLWIKAVTIPAVYAQIVRWRFNGVGCNITAAGKIAAFIVNSATATTSTTSTNLIADNSWKFITYSWDGTNIKLYVNGSLNSTGTGAKTVDYPDNDGFVLGSDGGSGAGYYSGSIKDFRIYGSVLTDDQISAMYSQGPNMPLGSPVMWIKMDEGTGTSCADSSASGYTGTIVGRTTTGTAPSTMWVIDPVRPRRLSSTSNASSVRFNGTTDKVVIADNAALNVGTGDFTVEGRVFVSDYNSRFFVAKQNTGTAIGWKTYTVGTTLVFEFNDTQAAAASSNVKLTRGKWHHFIASVTRATQENFKLFVNGVSDSALADTTTYADTAGTLSNAVSLDFMQLNNTNFMNGGLYDVRLYTRALTDDECLSRYYTNENITSGRVGWWKMNEGVGTVIADSQDSNPGTLTGGTWSTNTQS